MKKPVSEKAERFTESVIREMTRLANRYGAVNLAQGFPDFPAPEEVKQAAIRAVENDYNQYSITWGTKSLRDAIAKKYETDYGMKLDAENEITVCCGSTEAMMAAMLSVTNPLATKSSFSSPSTRTTAPMQSSQAPPRAM